MNRFTVLNSRTRFNSELSVRLVFMVSFLLHSTVLGALSTAQEIPHLIDPRQLLDRKMGDRCMLVH